ncbi:hypothetical protein D7Z26_13475 [Cohnella endophytica]|uniref:Uncharacterized protein n=1 Tax=Cohnella endophytica TaxID=2419778 RepID=A0A494Y1Z4_9BACL|nr:hypothetical protein [Cohnella endophytica]RKP54362.1 hypothetical protein D7Z26_13475 [Cohnella endophytica]
MSQTHQKAFVIFNKLVVNNIEDSSGIFIGTNQAIGWSTYSKSNQGFGSLSDATLSHSVSIVKDQDVIDTPIEDVRCITMTEAGHPLQQCAIDFNSIHANSLNNGSAIDLGDNKQLGWRSSRKNNYGFGKNLGSNQITQVANLVFDDDVVDAPIHNEGTITDNARSGEKNIRITQKNDEDD